MSSTKKTKQKGDVSSKTIDIIVPCRNESATLQANIKQLLEACDAQLKHKFTITIVDSDSDDSTLRIARKLSQKHVPIRVLHVDKPGRGLAIRTAIIQTKADIVAYMDEDLSTDLGSLHSLVEPLFTNEKLIVIGDRYNKKSIVKRNFKRKVLSIGYSWLARIFLRLGIKDYQCGFKAMRTSTAKKLLKDVENDQWFFDSELLAVAHDAGCSIKQIPITWTENTDSRVTILPTVGEFLRGLDRLSKSRKKVLSPERIVISSLVLCMTVLLAPAVYMNGWANTYYTMAVQAANQNWKAFFFGSLDSANFVTLDKPPFAVWLSAISARLFGFSTFSILLPHIIAGIVTLLIVYYMVRRYFGIRSAIVAGLCFMLTPIAVVVFRYNIPDSILTVLLVASAYTFLRAIEKPQLRWMLLTAVFMGFAFNTKMIQALIILPLYGLIYLLYSQQSVLKRIRDLAVTGLVFLVSALWWPIAVWLTPVNSRPFIGGTATNNIWELIAGYNGLNRFLGSNWKQPTGASVGAGFGGKVGFLRIFNEGFGSVIAWCIPLAVLAGILFWFYYKNPSNRLRRIAVLLWVGWVVMHAIVFGLTKGTIHPHYSVVLAPMIAALVGVVYWMYKTEMNQRSLDSPVLILLVMIMSACAVIMPLVFWKGRLWASWPTILVVSMSLGGLALFSWARQKQDITRAKLAFSVIFIALLFAPASSAVASSRTAQVGLIISAVPIHEDIKRIRTPESGIPKGLQKYLYDHRGSSTWIASTATAYDAAAVQLSTHQPVMTIGGFSGADNFLSLPEYKQYVKKGKVRYFIVNRQQSSEIKRCDSPVSKPGLFRSPLFNLPGGKCDKPKDPIEKPSTVNITNWAQTHPQIKQKDFGIWEVFDLQATPQENKVK